MTFKIKKTCPLGSKCQEVVGEEIHICEWFTRLEGIDPQTGKDLDEEGCAIRLNLLVSLHGSKAQDRATNTLNEGAQLFKQVLNATSNRDRQVGGSGSEHRLAPRDITTECDN